MEWTLDVTPYHGRLEAYIAQPAPSTVYMVAIWTAGSAYHVFLDLYSPMLDQTIKRSAATLSEAKRQLQALRANPDDAFMEEAL